MAELTVDMTYGKALFLAASDVGKTAILGQEGKAIQEILNGEPEFWSFLVTPAVSAAEKKRVLQEVFGGRVNEELLNFLFILIDKGRITQFASIMKRYQYLLDEENGVCAGTIFSVKPLASEQLVEFERQTGALLRKNVTLRNELSSQIIGGVRIFVDGKMIDATVQTRLSDLSESLK